MVQQRHAHGHATTPGVSGGSPSGFLAAWLRAGDGGRWTNDTSSIRKQKERWEKVGD